MKKKRIIRILRIIGLSMGVISLIIFVPWDILPWITPLPDTVQEQVDAAIDHGLDGIIVYVDQTGKAPAFYTAGWKNKANQVPADPQALFKIGSISKLYIAAATAKLVNNAMFYRWMIHWPISSLNLLEGLNMPIRLP